MSIQAVAWVLDYSQSRGVTRLVLVSLANHADKENAECWPSIRSIASEAGIGKSTVARHIDKLKSLGEVEVVESGGFRRATRYRLPKVSVPERDAVSASWGGQNHHEPEEEASTTSYGSVPFTKFNVGRAVDAVDQRIKDGLPVKSRKGLAMTIARDPDHVAESERIWAHQDCGTCGGSGFEGKYAPGTGGYQVECSAAPGGGA